MRCIMKRFLKCILPKWLVRLVREHANTRTYPTWNAAKQAAEATYDRAFLSEFRARRAQLNKGIHPTIPAVLTECVALFGADIRIADFGGGTGDFGEALLALHPSVNYTVVESEVMVTAMAAADSAVTFASQMPVSCDVFFSSCTIPYLDDPFGVLEMGFNSAAKACVVARNSFADVEIYRVQIARLFSNGAGKVPEGYTDQFLRYAHRTAREADIIALAKKHGFLLSKKFPDESGVVPYKGRVYGGTLLFIRP